MLGLKPIKLLPARERVASALRKAIISKSIPEGAELTLENTAQELGVSVTPVAFLVVSGGNVRTVQLVDKASTLDNAIAALPELIQKLMAGFKDGKEAKKAAEAEPKAE